MGKTEKEQSGRDEVVGGKRICMMSEERREGRGKWKMRNVKEGRSVRGR